MMKKLLLEFDGKKCDNIKMTYTKDVDTFHILNYLNKLKFPFSETDENLAKYVVIELLNNSIRASSERGSVNPIKMFLGIESERLTICVKDGAGGFNLKKLPFDINNKIEEINIISDSFVTYREEKKYNRFGLGLYFAKIWADEFQLDFIDDNENPIIYKEDGSVYGQKFV